MVFLNKHILVLTAILSLVYFSINAQTNPNGHNKFYYDNGALSSEGNMKDGKPDGYWKNYYKNGKVKLKVTVKIFYWIVFGNFIQRMVK